MRHAARLLATFVATVVIGGIAVGACFAALVPGTVDIVTAHRYTVNQVEKLSNLAETTTVYWADGTKLGTLGLQDREIVTDFTQVPTRIQDAVIATEDRTFWTNDGIDLGAVFRAFLTNVVSGEINQGGSTITQQLVKNRIVGAKRDVNRKIREIEDALRLNEKFSKQKIMLEYLNTVYFGSGSYGIKAAARRFFTVPDATSPVGFRGKNMDELTIGEAALLAGMIQSPEGNSPFLHPDTAIRRRADVLRGEVESGFITQAESDAANNEPLPTIQPLAEQRPTNFLVAEVQDRLLDMTDRRYDETLGTTLAERESKLLKGGLQIYSTFDRNMQAVAEDSARSSAAVQSHGPGWEASLVSIQPSTGEVKAMFGGGDFVSQEYNVATHDPGRQPGSTFKTITLAAALANGYSPNDIIDGTQPCSVPSIFKANPGQPPPQTINSEPHEGGPMTLLEATAGSVNSAFVRLYTSVGASKVIEMAHALGVTQDLQNVLTTTIGVNSATPLEMATVMSTIANDGVKQTPIFVSKIVDRDGLTILDDSHRTGQQALPTDVAQCEQNVLRRVITNGTGGNAAVAGHTAYGKTGTTDELKDAWFIGATPQLATAVWFGYYEQPIPGAGFGGDSAAPIFADYMTRALDGTPDLGLPPPGLVCARGGQRVNENGGRGAALSAPVLPATQQQSVVQLPSTPAPTAAPSAIPAPAVTTAPPAAKPAPAAPADPCALAGRAPAACK